MNQNNDQEENHGQEFLLKGLASLKKRKLAFSCIVFLFLIFGFIHIITARPVYKSNSTILIGTQTSQQFAGKGQQFDEVDPTNTEYYKTQYALLESRTVVKSVIQKLDLLVSEEFKPKPPSMVNSFIKDGLKSVKDGVKSLLKFFGPAEQSLETEKNSFDPYTPLINQFMGRLKVSPVSQSHVVRIGFEGYSPKMITEINNGFLDALIRRNINRRSKILEGSEKWMTEKILDLKEKMKDAEVKLAKFRKKNDIIDFKKNREISAHNLSQYQDQIRKVQSEKLRISDLKNLLIELKNNPVNLLHTLPDDIKTSTANVLISSYALLVKEYGDLTNEYSPLHPKVQALSQKMKVLEESVPEEIDRLIASIDIDFRGTVLHEQSLEKAMRKAKSQIMRMDNQEFNFNSLSSDFDTNKILHDDLLKRFKEIDIASYSSESSIQIVDRAEIPLTPIRPKKGFAMLLSMFMGVLGGSFWVMFLEKFDKTMIKVEDVIRQIPFPFLGATGIIEKKNLPLPIANNSNTFLAEEFRTVKTNLMLNGFVEPNRVLLVTSATPGEGKTTVLTNLAATFAQDGKKVLVIDADFTRPKIAKILETENKPGLLDILESPRLFQRLMGNNILDSGKIDRIFLKSVVEGVYVLPRGDSNTKCTDILNYGIFDKILSVTRKVFDVVLIDAPPALAFSYVSVAAQLSDGVMFVIGSGMEDRELIRRTLNSLGVATSGSSFGGKIDGHNGQNGQNGQNGSDSPARQSRIFGVVLNKVKYERDEYYEYHRKYFQEYYSASQKST